MKSLQEKVTDSTTIIQPHYLQQILTLEAEVLVIASMSHWKKYYRNTSTRAKEARLHAALPTLAQCILNKWQNLFSDCLDHRQDVD